MKKKQIALTLLCCAGILGFCACGGEESADSVTATVCVDAQVGGKFIYPFTELTVSSTAAEDLGLSDTVDPTASVSALDVLVAAHQDLYGDDAASRINVEEGWIEKAFEQETDYWSVLLNGESPHSDVESVYGGYEALIINQTAVFDGDIVEFIANQDTVNFADNALWIMRDGNCISTLELTAGESVDLNVQGYPCSFYGSYGIETIAAEYLAPVAGAQLGLMAEDGTVTAMEGATCDGEGNVSLTLSEAGDYVVVAYVPAGSDVYAFFAPISVTVK